MIGLPRHFRVCKNKKSPIPQSLLRVFLPSAHSPQWQRAIVHLMMLARMVKLHLFINCLCQGDSFFTCMTYPNVWRVILRLRLTFHKLNLTKNGQLIHYLTNLNITGLIMILQLAIRFLNSLKQIFCWIKPSTNEGNYLGVKFQSWFCSCKKFLQIILNIFGLHTIGANWVWREL